MDILKDLTGITGEGFVTDDESVLSGYASDLSFSAGTKPEAEVCPGTTEEVSRIVKWANENNMPLIPVSSPVQSVRKYDSETGRRHRQYETVR